MQNTTHSAMLCAALAFVSPPLVAQAATLNPAISLYGQVHKALVALDDGYSTEFAMVDNSVASTRLGLKAQQPLNSSLTASFLLEVEMPDNPGFLTTQNTAAGTPPTPVAQNSPASFSARHARVGLGTPFGSFLLGRQSMATDGVSEQDLAGVGYMMYSLTTDLAAGYKYRDNTGALQESIGALSSNLDGFRQNAVAFHTVKCNGLQGRFSAAQGGNADMALFYDKKMDDFTMRAAGGMQWHNDAATIAVNTPDRTLSGSFSIRHASGLAATVAGGQQTLQNAVSGAENPYFTYVKLGYNADDYSVAIDYNHSANMERDNVSDESDALGLGAQIHLTDGALLTGLYRRFSAQKAGENYQDVNLFALGMLVRF